MKYTEGVPLSPPWPCHKRQGLPQSKISTCSFHFTCILGLDLPLLVGQHFPFWLHLSPDSASQLDKKGLDNHKLDSKNKHVTLWTPICAPHLRPQSLGSAPFQTSPAHPSNNLKLRGWTHPVHWLDHLCRLPLTSYWNPVDRTPHPTYS